MRDPLNLNMVISELICQQLGLTRIVSTESGFFLWRRGFLAKSMEKKGRVNIEFEYDPKSNEFPDGMLFISEKSLAMAHRRRNREKSPYAEIKPCFFDDGSGYFDIQLYQYQ